MLATSMRVVVRSRGWGALVSRQSGTTRRTALTLLHRRSYVAGKSARRGGRSTRARSMGARSVGSGVARPGALLGLDVSPSWETSCMGSVGVGRSCRGLRSSHVWGLRGWFVLAGIGHRAQMMRRGLLG